MFGRPISNTADALYGEIALVVCLDTINHRYCQHAGPKQEMSRRALNTKQTKKGTCFTNGINVLNLYIVITVVVVAAAAAAVVVVVDNSSQALFSNHS